MVYLGSLLLNVKAMILHIAVFLILSMAIPLIEPWTWWDWCTSDSCRRVCTGLAIAVLVVSAYAMGAFRALASANPTPRNMGNL